MSAKFFVFEFIKHYIRKEVEVSWTELVLEAHISSVHVSSVHMSSTEVTTGFPHHDQIFDVMREKSVILSSIVMHKAASFWLTLPGHLDIGLGNRVDQWFSTFSELWPP